ncbi:hypothetical protein FNO01nite_34500 [Flavobacterium noncentrifugens]|uniref:Uncharacterized protein n=1 Tax=Flavobacterium noncentrifugens TaxID=1128970 RepID=A0A1G9C294_9FLAO|nr:acetolactate decarboxylase [Flavobacterium noncentrifugens]GEP52778.1 hypothetical protein FNO01nite_34500 [Flavobacterium noncentrifugens]SDK45809.1 hypothetical protein SAMN04487935_3449 [Flavobacterium noncentrifugens]
MRKFFPILFIFFLNKSFGQNEQIRKEITADILQNAYNYSKPKVVNQLDKSRIEEHLQSLIESKNGFFAQRINNSSDSLKSIVITKDERKYLIKSIRNQYDLKWRKEDFENYEILDKDDSESYLKSKKKNTTVEISNPIFLEMKNMLWFTLQIILENQENQV